MEQRVEIVAVKEFRYDSHHWMPGDKLTAKEKDAKLLKLVGKARDPDQTSMATAHKAVEPTPEKAATYHTRDMAAERHRGRPAPVMRNRVMEAPQAAHAEHTEEAKPEAQPEAKPEAKPAMSSDSAASLIPPAKAD